MRCDGAALGMGEMPKAQKGGYNLKVKPRNTPLVSVS